MKNKNTIIETIKSNEIKLLIVKNSINECESMINRIVNDIEDENDSDLVKVLEFVVGTLNACKKNQVILEANIEFLNNELKKENTVQSLLYRKLELTKREEAKLRDKFYAGEYDSALVNKMIKLSTQIRDLKSLLNNKLREVDDNINQEIETNMTDSGICDSRKATEECMNKIRKNKSSDHTTLSNSVDDEDEYRIVTLPSSGFKLKFKKVDDDELDRINMCELIKNINSNQSSDLCEFIEFYDKKTGITQKILTDWFDKNTQDNRDGEKMKQKTSKDIGYLDMKKKEQIKEKYDQTIKKINDHKNEVRSHSTNNCDKQKHDNYSNKKTASEMDEEIIQKVMSRVPYIISEEMKKVIDNMNK